MTILNIYPAKWANQYPYWKCLNTHLLPVPYKHYTIHSYTHITTILTSSGIVQLTHTWNASELLANLGTMSIQTHDSMSTRYLQSQKYITIIVPNSFTNVIIVIPTLILRTNYKQTVNFMDIILEVKTH